MRLFAVFVVGGFLVVSTLWWNQREVNRQLYLLNVTVEELMNIPTLKESLANYSVPLSNVGKDESRTEESDLSRNVNSTGEIPAATTVPVPSCDCTDPKCKHDCHRGIIGVHKMGFTVQGKISSLFYKKRNVAITELARHPSIEKKFGPEFRTPSKKDYRHILVVRKLSDSFISGYLYHKSGRECWLDQYGNNVSQRLLWLGDNRQESWEYRIRNSPTRQIQPWPSGKRRDLCHYLAEESEEDGMRVYMEWALDIYVRPLVEFWNERRGTNKTLLLCFEDQMANFVPTLQEMSRFLGMEVPEAKKVLEFYEKLRKGSEGHSTEREVAQSTRLHDMVERYDRDLFNSTIVKWDADFGCSRA